MKIRKIIELVFVAGGVIYEITYIAREIYRMFKPQGRNH